MNRAPKGPENAFLRDPALGPYFLNNVELLKRFFDNIASSSLEEIKDNIEAQTPDSIREVILRHVQSSGEKNDYDEHLTIATVYALWMISIKISEPQRTQLCNKVEVVFDTLGITVDRNAMHYYRALKNTLGVTCSFPPDSKFLKSHMNSRTILLQTISRIVDNLTI
jgi:hypothetical protein